MHREPLLINRARQLRNEMSAAEKRLWYRIRRKQINGHRFRRQVPIGCYIADFACFSPRLVLEIDGDSHANEIAEAEDAGRTNWLRVADIESSVSGTPMSWSPPMRLSRQYPRL